jgi:hypothetical protein
MDIVEPLIKIFKTFPVGQIEYKHDADGRPEIGFGNRSEPFLSSSVPNLKLDCRPSTWTAAVRNSTPIVD